MIETTLHGLVVGLGKIRKDGSKEFHWLDKPIHNRIVSGGLDYCLTYNGNNSAHVQMAYANTNRCKYNPWRRIMNGQESTFQYSGCLQYLSIGTDGSATSFIDTALKSQVGGYSETPAYSIAPYNGVMVENRNDKVLHLRITLQSVAVENETTVREVGWHGKIYNQNIYPMFSRVVLPTPITLESGEMLTVCYQMNVTLGWDEYEISSSLLSGLLDSDGNQVRAFSKRLVNNYIDDADLGKYVEITSSGKLGEFAISGKGNGDQSNNSSYSQYNDDTLPYGDRMRYVMKPPFLVQDDTRNGCPSKCLIYSTNVNFVGPVPSSNPPSDYAASSYDSATGSYEVIDYTPGTYYRDISVTVAPDWPNISEGYSDVTAIIYNGQVLRFGHYDNTDTSNPVWVPKPWRKYFGQSYKFTFRYKLSTADTV